MTSARRQYILDQYKKLAKEIAELQENTLEDIAKILSLIFNNLDTLDNSAINDYINDIIDLIYDFLENIYILTLTACKKIYHKVLKKTVPIVPYDKDGKTLEERIKAWVWFYVDQAKEDKTTTQPTRYKIQTLNVISRIVNQEGLILKNKIIHDKVAGLAEFVEIFSDNCCEACADRAGIYPISEEPTDGPPFHINCVCEPVYDITDDLQEMEDEDLLDDMDIEE